MRQSGSQVLTRHLAVFFDRILLILFERKVSCRHLAGGGVLPQSIIYGRFFYKANHAQELMEETGKQPIPVEVVKVVQLSAQQFRHFSRNLLQDMPFIATNKALAGCKNGASRCLLVTVKGKRDGILVDCQGYNYARYSAYVPDKRSLNLRDVPVEHYDLKPRKSLPGQDR